LLISPPNFYNKTDIIIAEKAKEIEEMFILRGPLPAKEIYDIKTDKFIYLFLENYTANLIIETHEPFNFRSYERMSIWRCSGQ
jgi:hypothetical protein